MTHLGLRNAILLGSEFGAAVALAFSIHHPTRVLGLVLCQPAGLLPSAQPRKDIRIGQILRRGAKSVLSRSAEQQARNEQRIVDTHQAHHAVRCNQAALSVLALEDSLRASLAHGPWPILVVLSDRNPIYPLKPFLQFLDPVRSVTPIDQPGRPKLAVFPGRHSPLWDDPARFAQILSGFASSTAPLSAHAHSWTLAAVDWPARGLNQWLCTHPGCRASQALPVDENPNRTLRRH
jgi:pimeloyl-ACP methyl ester carboxylesterase